MMGASSIDSAHRVLSALSAFSRGELSLGPDDLTKPAPHAYRADTTRASHTWCATREGTDACVSLLVGRF